MSLSFNKKYDQMRKICQMTDNESIVYSKKKILLKFWLNIDWSDVWNMIFFFFLCATDFLLMRFSIFIVDILLIVAFKSIRLYENLQHSHFFFFF